MDVRFAVLGGGLTGVTLARLLHEQGDEAVVLEREDAIGGLCRSRREAGFTFDIGGSHIIFSRDDEVLGLMLSALDWNVSRRKRNTQILYKGRYIKYPFENGLYQLPDEDRFFCTNEFIKNLIAVERGEIPSPTNFAEWITYTFGRGIAECYMIPYNKKVWNYPIDQMSHHWVEGRVPRPPVEDIIRSAVGIETEGYTHQAIFSYPVEGGIEALVRGIAEPILPAIKTGFDVTSIKEKGGGYVISSDEETISADHIISTIPLQSLLSCLEDVPQKVQAACDALRYNSLCSVFIGIKGEVPGISWLYVPDEGTGLFNRISFPSNYSTKVAPEGHASILAEITYNDGDAVSQMSDTEVADQTVRSLVTADIIPSLDAVVYTGVERQKFAYVVYDIEYKNNIRVVREFCSERDIDLVGRFSRFEYLNMDGCIRSAMDYVKVAKR